MQCYVKVCEQTNALLVVITQRFNRGSDGKCTKCNGAEGAHYNHLNGKKYCYVSSTSLCPPLHVNAFVMVSLANLIVCVLCMENF